MFQPVVKQEGSLEPELNSVRSFCVTFCIASTFYSAVATENPLCQNTADPKIHHASLFGKFVTPFYRLLLSTPLLPLKIHLLCQNTSLTAAAEVGNSRLRKSAAGGWVWLELALLPWSSLTLKRCLELYIFVV